MLQQFQDGEVRTRYGVPYVRQGGQWVRQGGVAAPAAPAAPMAAPAGIPELVVPPQPEQPRPLAPRYPDEAAAAAFDPRIAEANARKAEADARAAEAALQAGGGSPDQRRDASTRMGDMDAIVRQIQTVEDLYERNLAGVGVGSLTEYLPTPSNRAFDAAGAGLSDLALAAFRVPGVGAQSDRELAAFVAANQPRASDSDAEIRQKIANIRNRVDARRAALGMEPANWGAARPAAAAGAAAPTDVPTESGFGGIDEQGNIVVDVVGGQRPSAQAAIVPTSSFWDDLGSSTANVLAGTAQGFAAIPDAAINAAGAVLSLPADALGFDNVARDLRDPYTIGGAIERAFPTPEDGVGRAVRFGSQFLGGAASLPRGAANAIARQFGGSAPPPIPPVGRAFPSRSEIMEDAAALDIPMMPADVGGPATRLLTAGIAQTPLGAGPIVRAGQATLAGGQRALERIARGSGAPTNAETAGETATAGALRFRETSRTSATRLYDRAAQLSEGVRVVPERAMATLQRHIDELSENPAGDEALGFLTGLRDRLAASTEGVTVPGIRGMRTQLRDRFFSAGLHGTDVERRVMQVVDEASDDVAETLTNAGRAEAAEAYRAADAAWAARVDAIDNVIMPIIGKRGEKSGEQVFRALQSASSGNGVRLQRFMDALPTEEAGTVRASLINALGRATSGRQNAAGDAFSLDTFLTNWNNLGPTARRTMFGPDVRTAIGRLANIAENTKAAGTYANRSNTGGVVMTGVTGASVAGGLPALAGVMASQYAAGRLLASPAVARALAKVGSSRNPRQARVAIRDLSGAAARNPALAEDIGELQRRLTEAFSTSPALSAAAEEN